MQYKKLGGLLILVLGIISGIIWWQSQNPSLEEIRKTESAELFRALLFNPIPKEISDIYGFENQQGRSITYLTFTIQNASFLPKLEALHDYTSMPCSVIKDMFIVPDGYRADMDFWQAGQLISAEDHLCYQSLNAEPGATYSNSLRTEAWSVFMIDATRKDIPMQVYFVEQGM